MGTVVQHESAEIGFTLVTPVEIVSQSPPGEQFTDISTQFNLTSELECLSLMVATLCHDLDHRGTTNSFQIASQSVLASLYSSEGSVMERHHFAQTMCILNTSECNIFENLPPNEYEECINLLRELILGEFSIDFFEKWEYLEDLRSTFRAYCRTRQVRIVSGKQFSSPWYRSHRNVLSEELIQGN